MVQIKSAYPARIARSPFFGTGGHLISTASLTPDDVDQLCELASDLATGRANATRSAGHTVALLFFQASTRTRLGFEVATFAIGCQAIGMADMGMSRSNERTGESLEDCAAVVSRLCDAIVVRHHGTGAAARMAAKSRKPVINAGDGWNEHPTQALIDIFAMRKGLKQLRGPQHRFRRGSARTDRALAGCNCCAMRSPPRSCSAPAPRAGAGGRGGGDRRAPDPPARDRRHRRRAAQQRRHHDGAVRHVGHRRGAGTDYLSPRVTPASHRITAERIERTKSKALLYHPLPRQDEIDPDCDDLSNAMYFEQVRLSKYMRMAVLDRALATD